MTGDSSSSSGLGDINAPSVDDVTDTALNAIDTQLPDISQTGFSQAFTDVANYYGKLGIKVAKGEFAQITDIVKQGVDEAKKALAVAQATAQGAAIGACAGWIGSAVGATVAGIYSTFDKFGPEIQHFFNPPSIDESQYDQMRKRAIMIGALPVPGKAPDNEDGCIFPDGTTSGGLWPRHPPPGQQSIRGDDPWPGGVPPVYEDPIAAAADATARAATLQHLGSYIQGLQTKVDPLIAAAKINLAKKGTTTAQRNKALDQIAAAFKAVWLATSPGTPDVAGFRADMDKMIPHPPPITPADLVQLLKGANLKTMISTKPPNLKIIKTPIAIQTIHANATDAAHAVVAAANAGDPQAQQGIKAVVDGANAGDPTAQHVLSILTVADAQQQINRMIAKWVFGVGA